MSAMKGHSLLFIFLLVFVVFSCSSNHPKPGTTVSPAAEQQPPVKEKLKKGEVYPSVVCEQDPSQAYSLYLPKNYSDSVKFPVVIFFDPHGSGAFPVGLYKSLADRFGYVLMGSNNSKNGLQFDQTNVIANSLISESVSKFSGYKRNISLAGFSGGAKVALIAAANNPDLCSVIYCGASIPFENVNQLPPALGFAGEKDMNYTEVLFSAPSLDQKKIMNAVVEWKGKHEWSDSSTFEDAFYWIGFNLMRNKMMPVNKEIIEKFLQRKNKELSASKNKLTQSGIYKEIITFLQPLADVSLYAGKLSSLTQAASYRKEKQQQENTLLTERNMKQNYSQCFESKDLNWWQDEIKRMRNIKGEQEMMYQRLLAYLSLAGYSYSNNAVKQNNFSAAQQFLSVYKLADPENSEQPFLLACMYARQGDQQKALAALEEALNLGLKDKAKIESEESFNNLRSNPGFNNLLSRL
jgi:hypothetical protein